MRYWFDKVPPLDFFTLTTDGIEYHDLAAERGITGTAANRYRYRLISVTSERSNERGDDWTEWQETATTLVPLFDDKGQLAPGVPRRDETHRFMGIEVQVDRGEGWSPSTILYGAYGSGRLVALDR